MESKFRQELKRNLEMAILEVEEHTSQDGVQVMQLETKDINKSFLVQNVTEYMNYDKDLAPYYSPVDIYMAVTEFLGKR